ncbi:MAG: YjgN family protein, partial [Methylophilaceae bacterium]
MSATQTPVVFRGRASEYLGIWIVNLLLSMMTFGIYSAWAKVRRKKYFYNNTLIDGVGFDYHANPVAILKGRIIAFVLYLIFAFAPQALPPDVGVIVSGILSIALFIAIPWIVVRGLKFNARNSSHRGLRFDFDGQYKEAALLYMGLPIAFGAIVGLVIGGLYSLTSATVTSLVAPLLVMAGLAIYVPFIMQRQHQFVVSKHKFGTSSFDMKATIKDFFFIFLKLFLVLAGIGIVASLITGYFLKDALPGLIPKTSALNPPAYVQTLVTSNQEGEFLKVANTEPVSKPKESEALTLSDQLSEAEKADLAATEDGGLTGADENITDEDMLTNLSPE